MDQSAKVRKLCEVISKGEETNIFPRKPYIYDESERAYSFTPAYSRVW
jgi:hypothetical protein